MNTEKSWYVITALGSYLLATYKFGLCTSFSPLAYVDETENKETRNRLVFYMKSVKTNKLLNDKMIYINPYTLKKRIGYVIGTNQRVYYIKRTKELIPCLENHSLISNTFDGENPLVVIVYEE